MSLKYIIYLLSVVCVRLFPHTYTLCVYLCGGASGTYTIRKCEPDFFLNVSLFKTMNNIVLQYKTRCWYIIQLKVENIVLGQDTSVQWRDSYKAEIPKGEKVLNE